MSTTTCFHGEIRTHFHGEIRKISIFFLVRKSTLPRITSMEHFIYVMRKSTSCHMQTAMIRDSVQFALTGLGHCCWKNSHR